MGKENKEVTPQERRLDGIANLLAYPGETAAVSVVGEKLLISVNGRNSSVKRSMLSEKFKALCGVLKLSQSLDLPKKKGFSLREMLERSSGANKKNVINNTLDFIRDHNVNAKKSKVLKKLIQSYNYDAESKSKFSNELERIIENKKFQYIDNKDLKREKNLNYHAEIKIISYAKEHTPLEQREIYVGLSQYSCVNCAFIERRMLVNDGIEIKFRGTQNTVYPSYPIPENLRSIPGIGTEESKIHKGGFLKDRDTNAQSEEDSPILERKLKRKIEVCNSDFRTKREASSCLDKGELDKIRYKGKELNGGFLYGHITESALAKLKKHIPWAKHELNESGLKKIEISINKESLEIDVGSNKKEFKINELLGGKFERKFGKAIGKIGILSNAGVIAKGLKSKEVNSDLTVASVELGVDLLDEISNTKASVNIMNGLKSRGALGVLKVVGKAGKILPVVGVGLSVYGIVDSFKNHEYVAGTIHIASTVLSFVPGGFIASLILEGGLAISPYVSGLFDLAKEIVKTIVRIKATGNYFRFPLKCIPDHEEIADCLKGMDFCSNTKQFCEIRLHCQQEGEIMVEITLRFEKKLDSKAIFSIEMGDNNRVITHPLVVAGLEKRDSRLPYAGPINILNLKTIDVPDFDLGDNAVIFGSKIGLIFGKAKDDKKYYNQKFDIVDDSNYLICSGSSRHFIKRETSKIVLYHNSDTLMTKEELYLYINWLKLSGEQSVNKKVEIHNLKLNAIAATEQKILSSNSLAELYWVCEAKILFEDGNVNYRLDNQKIILTNDKSDSEEFFKHNCQVIKLNLGNKEHGLLDPKSGKISFIAEGNSNLTHNYESNIIDVVTLNQNIKIKELMFFYVYNFAGKKEYSLFIEDSNRLLFIRNYKFISKNLLIVKGPLMAFLNIDDLENKRRMSGEELKWFAQSERDYFNKKYPQEIIASKFGSHYESFNYERAFSTNYEQILRSLFVSKGKQNNIYFLKDQKNVLDNQISDDGGENEFIVSENSKFSKIKLNGAAKSPFDNIFHVLLHHKEFVTHELENAYFIMSKWIFQILKKQEVIQDKSLVEDKCQIILKSSQDKKGLCFVIEGANKKPLFTIIDNKEFVRQNHEDFWSKSKICIRPRALCKGIPENDVIFGYNNKGFINGKGGNDFLQGRKIFIDHKYCGKSVINFSERKNFLKINARKGKLSVQKEGNNLLGIISDKRCNSIFEILNVFQNGKIENDFKIKLAYDNSPMQIFRGQELCDILENLENNPDSSIEL